ncbi:hypothetical protein B7463_g11514, partial [Scytalidium lignicola]
MSLRDFGRLALTAAVISALTSTVYSHVEVDTHSIDKRMAIPQNITVGNLSQSIVESLTNNVTAITPPANFTCNGQLWEYTLFENDRVLRGWAGVENYNMTIMSYFRAEPWFCTNGLPKNSTEVPMSEVREFVQLQSQLNQTNNQTTSLATRDAYGVSKRFIWTWAASAFAFSVVGVATSIWGSVCSIYGGFAEEGIASKKACAFASFLGILTAGFGAFSAYKAVTSAAAGVSNIVYQEMYITNYAQRIGDTSAGIGNLGNPFRRRQLTPDSFANVSFHNSTYKLHHHGTGEFHNAYDIFFANKTHPLLTKVSSPKSGNWSTNPTMRIWHQLHPTKEGRVLTVVSPYNPQASSRKREIQCGGGVPGEGGEDQSTDINFNDGPQDQLDYCTENAGNNGNPDQVYYGFDLYDTGTIDEFEDDLGDAFPESNGMVGTASSIADQGNVWDGCVCTKVGGTWTSTGSVQYSWDDTYNGYSECWNANCDGA